ncbi:TBC1 domain family member 31-like, partial [Stegodyphus dumicola]|uniref:TBC1 domain family member 31-like n=1 Tax=Stegodyphus dumicola TaxID=202533 RepID=UPI0015AC7D49
MESYLLDICSREQGLLLQNKTFVPLNGPLLSISNSSHNKIVSFVHAAWDKSSSKIVAGDSFGNIYMFYLQKNKFVLLYHWHNACCTFLTFSPDKRQEVIVALSDCSVVSLNSDSKTIENQFNHHISCVSYISFDKSGRRVLSCSKDQAILWNLNTFQILRYLTLRKSIDIVKVFFHPSEDIIILAFKDSSVFLWSSENFICTNRFICTSEDVPLNIKCIDISSDGKLLACAGKANWFTIWSTEENKKLYNILLPSNVIVVKQIYFLTCLQGLTEGYVSKC